MNLAKVMDSELFDSFKMPSIGKDIDIKSDFYTDKETNTVDGPFSAALDSAVGLIKKTNDLSNAAEMEEIRYAAGQSDNLHDLMVAQQKANVSLQYTVAVRDAVMQGYRELMNMQF
ncbi:MAG: flagellar hook-basal body complex protein FliE [Lachnospiraceae bacterium]|jgi:flagellar hook-basal body complex protein FliE|nr:flagellar hook-basal body complex protein FliE [Lachnospiraceae bacterium]MEE3460458.1 flagellar hook-basal body complex protein FliE [Lachnospiraceae bacterium]